MKRINRGNLLGGQVKAICRYPVINQPDAATDNAKQFLSAAVRKSTKSGGLKISRAISSVLVLIDHDALSILKRRQNKLHVLPYATLRSG
jgi:hypothetical protein